MPSLYTLESPRKSHRRRAGADARETQEQPRATSGFFRGVLFAMPGALLLWALVIAGVRALLHHL